MTEARPPARSSVRSSARSTWARRRWLGFSTLGR
jgi:hypothetical protein